MNFIGLLSSVIGSRYANSSLPTKKAFWFGVTAILTEIFSRCYGDARAYKPHIFATC